MDRSVIHVFFLPEVNEYRPLILSLFDLIQRQFYVTFLEVDSLKEPAALTFGSSYPVSKQIYTQLTNLTEVDKDHRQGIHICFDTHSEIIDPLASAFSILHCLSEQNNGHPKKDKFGRQTYAASVYKQYHSSSEDLVSPLFRIFLEEYCNISMPRLIGIRRVLLSHDIDFLASGFKQEFKYFIKHPSVSLFRALIRHLFTKNKLWGNINDIIQLELRHNVKSTFYLLPIQGVYNGISNADYTIETLSNAATLVFDSGMEIGLHKSTSEVSYKEEAILIECPHPFSNRNHFLKYKYPESWAEMSGEGVSVDTGLGWSDAPGLRNGYPFPFQPLVQPFGIRVVPLILMDTSFQNFDLGMNIVDYFKEMVSEWKDGFTVSILFHNNFLTTWSNKYYLEQYKLLLNYLNESAIEVIDTSNINTDNQIMP